MRKFFSVQQNFAANTSDPLFCLFVFPLTQCRVFFLLLFCCFVHLFVCQPSPSSSLSLSLPLLLSSSLSSSLSLSSSKHLSIRYLSIISYVDLSIYYTFISLLVHLAVLNSVNHSCPYLFL